MNILKWISIDKYLLPQIKLYISLIQQILLILMCIVVEYFPQLS